MVLRTAVMAMAMITASGAQAADGLWPLEFANKVRANGGRVDFVFGAKRPFAQCHASTVAQAADGTLVAAWFGGTAEKDDDVGIWFSRFDGKEWSAPERAAKVNNTPHWNPVLFTDADGMLNLFFKIGPEISFWQTYWMQSKDGKTWTDPKELVAGDEGGRGPVKNKAIILRDGTWLAPASTEHEGWNCFADRSTDDGKTWKRSKDWGIDHDKMEGKGAIQPTLWESAPGKVHALVRTTAGRVWRADSENGGKTWTDLYVTNLPNNNSGLDALLLEDGRLLLVYNPVGKNWGDRTPLDLAVSTDNGKTWETIAHLEADADPESEFSYPAIIRSEDGVVITYTYQRERVRCWQVPLSAL
jgi:predicted neuraminidase